MSVQLRTLITGIAGQDGSYLAEQLLTSGKRVVGVVRGSTSLHNIVAIRDNIELVIGDITEPSVLGAAVARETPDEIYHLASVSSVGRSWDEPAQVLHSETLGTLNLLEAVRKAAPLARVILASSGEIFDHDAPGPRNESSVMAPSSPYAVGKASSLWLARCYRDAWHLRVSAAILFTHESPRRPLSFLWRKISQGVTNIVLGRARELRLGNLDIRRDWGSAEEYMRALQLMAGKPAPSDYVIGTGRALSVREVCELAFNEVGLDYRDYVISDPALYRPRDPAVMLSDPRRAREKLGWVAEKSPHELMREMLAVDRARLQEPPK
ncbi:MAG: GDP-mannose 4,6-dehydratase [Gemmatimonadota bacterium]